MATDNFTNCLALTLRFEGGYVDNPLDPGGATNMGITRRTLATVRGRAVAKAEVMALSRDEAAGIYRRLYWNVVAGDALPAGVDAAVFDMAVNSAPARAIRTLQVELGCAVGGPLDTATLAIVHDANASGLVRAICRQRLTFLQRLTTFATFGHGWSRRVRAIETAALAMIAGASPLRAPTTGVAHHRPGSGTQMKGLLMSMNTTADSLDSKPFWASQTIWSSFAVIGASITGGMLAWKSGDMGAFGAALTAALGGINSVAGRFRATSLIH